MMANEQQSAPNELSEESQPPVYYCRGCGRPQPQGSKARFHAQCRRRDKRRRVAQRRQREARREAQWFRARLRDFKCPECGASLAELVPASPSRSAEVARDVAQRASEPLNFKERPRAVKPLPNP